MESILLTRGTRQVRLDPKGRRLSSASRGTRQERLAYQHEHRASRATRQERLAYQHEHRASQGTRQARLAESWYHNSASRGVRPETEDSV
jgi:hypothetical protein